MSNICLNTCSGNSSGNNSDHQSDTRTVNQADHQAPKERKKEKKETKGGCGGDLNLIKIRVRYTFAVIKDHAVDASSLAIPAFFAIGIIAAIVRFWQWVFW